MQPSAVAGFVRGKQSYYQYAIVDGLKINPWLKWNPLLRKQCLPYV